MRRVINIIFMKTCSKKSVAKVLKCRKFLNPMRKGVSSLFVEGESFKREFKKQVRTFILFTFGFTVAFTWRQTIFDLSLSVVKWVTNIQNSAELSLLSSILVTIVSLIVIFLTSHWLKDGSSTF